MDVHSNEVQHHNFPVRFMSQSLMCFDWHPRPTVSPLGASSSVIMAHTIGQIGDTTKGAMVLFSHQSIFFI